MALRNPPFENTKNKNIQNKTKNTTAQHTEQKEFLQRLQLKHEDDDLSAKLFGAILAGDPEQQAIKIVERLRPDQLAAIRDNQGMSPLHAATRMLNVGLVRAILDKCPDLANVASRADRNPAHWTPIMTLADMGRGASSPDRSSEIIGAALVGNMSRAGLNNRAANFVTVSHLATSRGNVHILKKVLHRLNDLGGFQADKVSKPQAPKKKIQTPNKPTPVLHSPSDRLRGSASGEQRSSLPRQMRTAMVAWTTVRSVSRVTVRWVGDDV